MACVSLPKYTRAASPAAGMSPATASLAISAVEAAHAGQRARQHAAARPERR